MKISIRKDTKQRINAFASYTDANGVRYPTVPDDVYEWFEHTPPTEYQANPDHYSVVEIDDAPYVLYSKKTDEQIAAMQFAKFDSALTEHLDKTAQARRYDDRITCMVRAGFAGPFQAEGQAFATWCDTCNAMAYVFMSEVQAGTRPMPDSPKALIDALPVMEWPE